MVPGATLDVTPFPKSVEDFDKDPRIAFSRNENRWILEDGDKEWEWNDSAQKWIQTMDEDEIEQQQKAYGIAGVDETEPAAASKKRKKGDADGEANGNKKARAGNAENNRKNTSVYVTNVPLDATPEEVIDVFSKYGMIAESLESGQKRVRMYTDEQDNFKGDVLVTYFREESVALAINMLDDTSFRLGQSADQGNMRVAIADYSYKKEKAQDGEQPAKQRSAKEKKKIAKKLQKMNNKLADWDDDDPQTLQDTSSRYDKVVVMKHMFTLQELEEDPAALLEIKEDIREECSQYGEVTNVVLFDKEPAGIVTVRFGNAEAAKACVTRNHGRAFAGRVVEAYIADGSERFKKSSNKARTEEEEAEEDERRAKFGDWLNAQEDEAAA